jgi:Salmonella virulence plasmid 65kDa B protein
LKASAGRVVDTLYVEAEGGGVHLQREGRPDYELDGSRFKDQETVPGYTVHRYRPRIEGLFARLERWTRSDGDVHWRSISKDNILTLYGNDENARLATPRHGGLRGHQSP